jgi:hypothetical protein
MKNKEIGKEKLKKSIKETRLRSLEFSDYIVVKTKGNKY